MNRHHKEQAAKTRAEVVIVGERDTFWEAIDSNVYLLTTTPHKISIYFESVFQKKKILNNEKNFISIKLKIVF